MSALLENFDLMHSQPGAEEVVDMRGGGVGLTQTYGNDLHCLWFGKVRPKKKVTSS